MELDLAARHEHLGSAFGDDAEAPVRGDPGRDARHAARRHGTSAQRVAGLELRDEGPEPVTEPGVVAPLEVVEQRHEQRGPVVLPPGESAERGRRKPRSPGKGRLGLVDVHADPARDAAAAALEEDPRHLGVAHEHVVRPLHPRRTRDRSLDRPGDGERADERELRRAGR